MRPEIKKRWVEALRSGEYKQGTCQLKKEGRYCCLGVLTDLAIKDGVECGIRQTDTSWPVGLTPPAVSEWAKLEISGEITCNPHVNGTGLIELNDRVRLTFDEIADLIDRYL